MSRAVWIVMVAALAVALSAADVGGTWKSTSQTGPEIVLKLRAEGRRLSGTVRFDQGPERAISDGEIEGEEIRFQMPSMYGGLTHTVRGRLERGDLLLRIESESLGSITIRLKREAR